MEFKRHSFVKNIFLAILSALLLALTLPYPGWTIFVWVALVPLLLALRRAVSVSSAFVTIMVFGVIYWTAVVAPLFQLNTTWWTGDISASYGPALVSLLVFLVALYSAAFLLPVAYIERKYRTLRMRDVFIVALAWVAFEYIRSEYALLGYSWGVLGYTLVDVAYLRESARIVGVHGLSFFVIAVNMLLALTCERVSRKYTFLELKKVIREFIFSPKEKYWTASLVFIFLAAIGCGVLRDIVASPPLHTPLRVALIIAESDDDSVGEGLYRSYRGKIIATLSTYPETDILLLPENVFPFFEIDEEKRSLAEKQPVPLPTREVLYQDLLSLSRTYGTTTFAIGSHSVSGGKKYNTLVFYKQGEIIGTLHKQRLVPFFEYAPLGLPIPLFESFSKGGPEEQITLQGSTISTLICSEVSDGSLLPGQVHVVLSPSNDDVLTSAAVGRVQDVFARMRAIESGAYVIRASRGSVSSIIDPSGRILKTSRGDTILLETLY